MKWVKVFGRVDSDTKHLDGGSSKSIPVKFTMEDGSLEWVWVKASQVRWMTRADLRRAERKSRRKEERHGG